jgi:tetratricopeptide (TPR) repeat protein
MSKKYFTYRICVNNEQRVQIEKYDTERQSLGRPSGDFCYSKNREEIQQLLEIAHNNKLDKKQSCQLGEALFASLFDPVLSQDFLNFYFKVVQQEEQLLRIELDIDEEEMPEIAALPWEFLCLPERTNQGTVWLATDPNLVFSRRRALWNLVKPIQLEQGEKLRIALAISAPKDLPNVEYAEIQEYLEALANEQSEDIELLSIVNPATPTAINELLKQKPHIFHFIGHGRFENEEGEKIGQIALVRKILNKASWVDAKFFAGLFVHIPRPGIVILQACEGGMQSESEAFRGVAAKIVGQNIPVVVAMQYEVANATASVFSSEFYKRLGKGEPVDIAAQNGRWMIGLETQYINRDFATPVIFMNVQDGYLFTTKITEEQPQLSKVSRKILDSSIIEFIIPRCEVGLRRLMSSLEENNPDYQELWKYQSRLNEISEQFQKSGVSSKVSLVTQMEAIIENLNPYSEYILNKSFIDLYDEIGDAKVKFIDYPETPNEYFIGRSEILEKFIHQLIKVETKFIIISGIAGIGKTELAANIRWELISSHRIPFNTILWSELNEDDTIEGWWRGCAEVALKKEDIYTAKLLNSTSSKYQDKLECLIRFLDEKINLIFLENYHKIIGNSQLEELIISLIRKCPKTKFVIISRRYVTLLGKQPNELKGLNTEFGIQLIKSLDEDLKNVDNSLLEPVVQRYNGHILALQVLVGIRRRMKINARELRDFVQNQSILNVEDHSLVNLLNSLFSQMTPEEIDFTLVISLINVKVTNALLEALYPEYPNSGKNIIIQLKELFLLDSNEFIYQTAKVNINVTLLRMHDLIREFCQKSIANTEKAQEYHFRIARAWISILPTSIQNLILEAENITWPFLPEETSGERIDALLLKTDDKIPNLNYLDCIVEAYYHSFESRKYKKSAALLFLIDRYLYRWGLIPQLFDRIVQLERRGVQLAPQVIIRKARILKDKGEAKEVLKIADSLQINDNDLNVQAVADELRGEANIILGNYSQAIESYDAALQKHISLQNTKGISATYGLLGDSYLKLENYSEALKNYMAAYEINKANNQTYYSSRNLLRMGEVYLAQKQYQEAITKFKESLSLMENAEQKDSIDLARLRFLLSQCMVKNGQKLESQELLIAAINTFEKQKMDSQKREAEELLKIIEEE